MSDSQLTFEDLLVDEEEVNETLLTETLVDYIRIGDESGNLVPQNAYEELTNREKVIVVLLAQHALEGLDMTDQEWWSPTEIAEKSGIKKNSVYPAVRELDDADVVKNDDGAYRIPTHSLETAKRELELEENE